MDSLGTEKETTILDLNNDCLAAISKYMNFENLLNLFSCHTHFHIAIGISLGNVCVDLSNDDDYKKKMEFCVLFDKQVKHLHLNGDVMEIYKPIMNCEWKC